MRNHEACPEEVINQKAIKHLLEFLNTLWFCSIANIIYLKSKRSKFVTSSEH